MFKNTWNALKSDLSGIKDSAGPAITKAKISALQKTSDLLGMASEKLDNIASGVKEFKYSVLQFDYSKHEDLFFTVMFLCDLNVIQNEMLKRTYEITATGSVKAESEEDALEVIFAKENGAHEEYSRSETLLHSVSVGDLVLMNRKIFVCRPTGWARIDAEAHQESILNRRVMYTGS